MFLPCAKINVNYDLINEFIYLFELNSYYTMFFTLNASLLFFFKSSNNIRIFKNCSLHVINVTNPSFEV